MDSEDKKRIQAELEKLSWQFLTELDKADNQDEEAEAFWQAMDVEDKTASVEKAVPDTESRLSENDSAVTGRHEPSAEERFFLELDEDKLENYKIDAWHIPNKHNVFNAYWHQATDGIKRFGNLFWRYFISLTVYWPLKALKYLVVFLKELLKGIWLLLRESWLFLFGGLSLKRKVVKRKNKRESFDGVTDGNKHGRRARFVFVYARWKPVAAFALAVLLTWLPFKAYQTYYQAKNLKGQVLGVAKSGWEHLSLGERAGQGYDFFSAAKHFALARRNFELANKKINFLGGASRSLIAVIPQAKEAQKALRAAELFAGAGEKLAVVMDNLFESGLTSGLNQSAGGSKAEIDLDWREINNKLDTAFDEANQAGKLLSDIKINDLDLSSEQKEQLKQAQDKWPQILSWLKQARLASSVAAYLTAMEEPRRLMLVFQNNNELRPSGGFMGSYALVDIERGKIKKIEVPGGGFYDLKGSLAVRVDAPYPFHLFSPIWQPWNANWFYDWPTSARKIEWFYEKSGGSSVDGVLAFTPAVVEDLLRLTGPIEMPDYKLTVTADNFVKTAQAQVELLYDKQENRPKKFIGDLMRRLLERLAGLNKEKFGALWQLAQNNLADKNLLIYVNDNLTEEKLLKLDWAGQVKDTRGDYLAVIHTNIAGGKTDQVIARSLKYKVFFRSDGKAIVDLNLREEHKGKPGDLFEGHANVDYIRFYVPLGSRLIAAEGFTDPPKDRVFQVDKEAKADADLWQVRRTLKVDKASGTRISREFNKTVFGNWLIVKPGEVKNIHLVYELPFTYQRETAVGTLKSLKLNWWQKIKKYFWPQQRLKVRSTPNIYTLLMQKQPGVNNFKIEVELINANKRNFKEAYPAVKPMGDTIKYDFNLKTDSFFRVVF